MNNSYLHKGILVTAIAFIGLISVQTSYLFKELRIGQKQFDHRAHMALDKVVAELKDHLDTTSTATQRVNRFNRGNKGLIFDAVDTVFLDTIMHKYISYYQLDPNFDYAIVKSSNDSIVYSTAPPGDLKRRKVSQKVCLSCLYKKDYYNLSLFFHTKNRTILLQMGFWLLLSLVFIIIIVSSFIKNTLTIFKQKKLTEMKNDFINNMTHEFKTPIATITLSADILKTALDKHDDKLRNYVTIISEENQRMRNQVERVLEIARLDKENISLSISEFNINNIIYSTIQNMLVEQSSQTKVTYNLAKNLKIIKGDQLHLSNVISNLVDNAIKYARVSPEITLSTHNVAEGIEIHVTDNGIGLTRDQQKYIFDKFYRVSTGNIHTVKGFGLGLYYVKKIINSHGGTISVSSELNKGTAFVVFLPDKVKNNEML